MKFELTNFDVIAADVETILDWKTTSENSVEIPFKPARVLLQDFTGVPAVVDLAAMRTAMQELGGDPNKINPLCQADLVVDHSIQVDIMPPPVPSRTVSEVVFPLCSTLGKRAPWPRGSANSWKFQHTQEQ